MFCFPVPQSTWSITVFHESSHHQTISDEESQGWHLGSAQLLCRIFTSVCSLKLYILFSATFIYLGQLFLRDCLNNHIIRESICVSLLVQVSDFLFTRFSSIYQDCCNDFLMHILCWIAIELNSGSNFCVFEDNVKTENM